MAGPPPPATTSADIARAHDAFFDALVGGPWDYRPEHALRELEARRRELRALAAQVDRSLWPPGLATLLWAPASHERISDRDNATVLQMPDGMGSE